MNYIFTHQKVNLFIQKFNLLCKLYIPHRHNSISLLFRSQFTLHTLGKWSSLNSIASELLNQHSLRLNFFTLKTLNSSLAQLNGPHHIHILHEQMAMSGQLLTNLYFLIHVSDSLPRFTVRLVQTMPLCHGDVVSIEIAR